MPYGMKSATKGNRFDTLDLNKLSINSDKYALKLVNGNPNWIKSVQINSGTFNKSYTIQHNLGYIPLYDFYFKDQSGRLVHIPGRSTDTFGTRGRIISETINEIVVRIGKPDSPYGSNVIYDVFHQIFIDPER